MIGMTQQKLPQIVGVAFQQAHKYERDLSRISVGRLYRITAALEAPTSHFQLTINSRAKPREFN